MIEFPKASKAEWLAKVEKDLRGKAVSDLNFTAAGKTYSPFHHPEDLPSPPPPVRGPRTEPCRSGASLEITDPAADNKVILDLLNKGANALLLHSAAVNLADSLDQLLGGVYRELIDVYLLQGPPSAGIQSLRGEVVEMKTYDALYTGDEQQRTAYVMAGMLDEYARMLSKELNDAAVTFWVTVTDDYLTSIARLRALRLCYRLVADAFGVTTPCRIVAGVSSGAQDKYTAMISTAANVSAAITGGADTVFLPSGLGDDAKEKQFLRRVAANTYNVLDHEAYLNRVADPAAGSYYLETLTEDIARSAWAAFQKLSAR